jgi:hypothetical protein
VERVCYPLQVLAMNWWCMKVQNQKQGEHTIGICLLPMHSSNHYFIFFGHLSNAPTSICAHLLLHMPSILQWQLSTLLLPQILADETKEVGYTACLSLNSFEITQ